MTYKSHSSVFRGKVHNVIMYDYICFWNTTLLSKEAELINHFEKSPTGNAVNHLIMKEIVYFQSQIIIDG